MKVKSTTADITYEMTEDQIEAAYRYQEEHYREMDAKRFIDERLEWLDGDKDEFDCNVPENEIWDEVLGEYFGPVIEEDGE